MNYFSLIISISLIILSILMSVQESKRKPINVFLLLFLCIIITPLGAYLLCRFLPDRHPIDCSWCGNKYNEAEYCGLCGKNVIGETKNESINYSAN